jgi:hypothetical protein
MIVFARVNPPVNRDYKSRIELRQMFAYVRRPSNCLEALRGARRRQTLDHQRVAFCLSGIWQGPIRDCGRMTRNTEVIQLG